VKCKHPFFDRFAETKGVLAEPTNLTMVRQYCGLCGAWLSLGESDETDERVAIEIRAAEIAASDDPHRVMGIDEAVGFSDWYDGDAERPGTILNVRQVHAGYLARAIVMHKEPTR
jgi:hypothetical protein